MGKGNLHERKISELFKEEQDKLELKAERGGLKEAHVLADFILFKDKHKAWAIAVVKNCNKVIEKWNMPDTNEPIGEVHCGVIGTQPSTGKKHTFRCDACERFIEKFELTEEDLK